MKTIARKQISRLILISLLLGWGPAAQAFGMGFFVGYGVDDFTYDVGGANEQRVMANLGFVFDTSIAGDHLIHYRGFFGSKSNVSEYRDFSYDYGGWTMVHTMGFRLISNDRIRFWLGPQLSYTSYTDYTYNDGLGNSIDVSGDLVSVGLGPVIGLNFHTRRAFSMSWELALRSTSYTGTVDGWNFDGEATGYFLNMSFLWRLTQ